MLTKPGAGIWRTGGAFGSPIHTLFRARTADTQSHPASGMPTDTAGKPPPWRSRSETDEASWGTAVGPPSYTTYWGLLKQPDNQKPASVGSGSSRSDCVPTWCDPDDRGGIPCAPVDDSCLPSAAAYCPGRGTRRGARLLWKASTLAESICQQSIHSSHPQPRKQLRRPPWHNVLSSPSRSQLLRQPRSTLRLKCGTAGSLLWL